MVIRNVKIEEKGDLSISVLTSVWLICLFDFEKKQHGRTLNIGLCPIQVALLRAMAFGCSDNVNRFGDPVVLFL